MDRFTNGQISRRELLQGGLGWGVLALASQAVAAETGSGGLSVQSLIRQENEKAGTRDWMLKKTGVDPATKYRCPWIEGYCSRASVRTGEKITFHVSTNPPASFTVDIYRTGYYDDGKNPWYIGRDVAVSLNRPYGNYPRNP